MKLYFSNEFKINYDDNEKSINEFNKILHKKMTTAENKALKEVGR